MSEPVRKINTEEKKIYKPEIKEFLGTEVRIVNNEWIVSKDMFGALGRVKPDGTWTSEKNKMISLLKDLGKITDHQTLVVTSKGKRRSRESQEVECLRLASVPIVLTQFKPTSRKGEEALNTWVEFMKFVDNLLESLEVYRFLIVDKEQQKESIYKIIELGGKATITHQQVNRIMANLLNVYPEIKRITKDELKIYQPQTTIDLLSVREFALEKFANAFEFTGSHSVAYDMTLKLAKKKYDL